MAMSHNTSGYTGQMGEFESVVDLFIEKSVDSSAPCYFSQQPTLGKRKQGEEEVKTKKELYYFFYKALKERKLLSIWMQKRAVDKYRWRLDEIDTIMKQRGGPVVPKAEKAMQDLLKELSGELYSELF